MNYYAVTYSNSLSHHGVRGQKWGIRRYQNEDGTLTDEGKRRYGSLEGRTRRAYAKVFELNEKTYRKFGNKTLASMNKQAKNRQRKLADMADKRKAEKYNDDGSRRYSKEVRKKLGKNKAPMNVGEKVLNVASMGAYQAIKGAEMRYQGQSEKSRKNVSGGSLALRGVQRGFASQSNRYVIRMTKALTAWGGTAVYELSGKNPAVKAGVMALGKAMNVAGNISIASMDAYNLYAQARDTKHFIDKTRKKK